VSDDAARDLVDDDRPGPDEHEGERADGLGDQTRPELMHAGEST